ncbi:hypothetical protein BJX63DRAFT_426239 [Aspergillus granulosus]|uniref:Ankyrin n=1 Tax=Aspergillus granulosus TaxID=176169 RepID=A0ABR4GT46_9EURO
MQLDDDFVRDFCDACYDGQLSKVQEAINSGRLTAEVADDGLGLATDQSDVEIVAALFDAGTKLSTSAVAFLPGEHGHQDVNIVRQFLDHGLDPNSRYKKGRPILGVFPDLACARELLSRGADPNLCNDNGEPILEYGAQLPSSLLFYSVAPRVPQGEFMTSEEWGMPLHCAVRAEKPDIVKVLLDAGADPTVRLRGRKTRGYTPAEVAERMGKTDRSLQRQDCFPLWLW